MCFNKWKENNDYSTNYKSKDQATTSIFLDILCDTYIPSNDAVQDKDNDEMVLH